MLEVSVYCQPTRRNDRLTSLLSSVFLNPIRPDFTRAILEKAPSPLHHVRQKSIVGVLVVGGTSKQLQSLKRRIRPFASVLRYQLKIWSIPHSRASMNDEDMFLITLKEMSKTTDRLVFVVLDDTKSRGQKIQVAAFLAASQKLNSIKLVGCIAMQSAISDLSSFANHPAIPALILSSQIDRDEGHVLYPNLIWVILSDDALSHWYEDLTIGVWLVRTIAKYSEAATLLANEHVETKLSLPTSRL